jgi:hypothetical protein
MDSAKALRDEDLLRLCIHLDEQNKRQLAWCMTFTRSHGPGALVVPSQAPARLPGTNLA